MQSTHSKEEPVVRPRSAGGPIQFEARPAWSEVSPLQAEPAWQPAGAIALQPPTFGLPQAPAYPNLVAIPSQQGAFAGQQIFAASPQAGFAFRQASPATSLAPGTRVPPIDLVDEGGEFVVQVELPGVKREGIDVSCFERGILVTATAQPDIDIGALLISERASATSFRRAVNLPGSIQPSGAKATLRDGVLTLNLPKSNPTEGARRIPVA